MEAKLKEGLSRLGAEFVRVTGRKPGGVWAQAAKDSRFLERIESGQTFTLRTFDRAVSWFSHHWPQGAIWPDGVERPVLARAPLPDGTGEGMAAE